MVRAIIGFCLCTLLAQVSLAESRRHTNSLSLDGGLYVDNLRKRSQTFEPGLTSTASGFLRLRPAFSLGKEWYFEPGVGMVIPWRTGYDGTTRVYTFHLDLDVRIPLFSFVDLRIGPGIHWVRMTSVGETVSLNNGNGYSSFYLPSGHSDAFLMTVQGGLYFPLYKSWSLSLETTVLEIADGQGRDFNFAALLGFTL